VLDIPSFSTTPGTGAELWPINNGKNQQWLLKTIPNDPGYYNIINLHSGLVLDVPGGSKDDNVEVMQWNLQGNDSQKWAIYDAGRAVKDLNGKTHELYWILNKHSNKLLDVYGF
jgi:hypothetical protein